MNLPEWFTEENFNTWWKGKYDLRGPSLNFNGPRMKTCPLARFVRTHGLPTAAVNGTWLHVNSGAYLLPQWAMDAVEKFDLFYYGEPEK